MNLIKQHERAIQILEAIQAEETRISNYQDSLNNSNVFMFTERYKTRLRKDILYAMMALDRLKIMYNKQLATITSIADYRVK